MPVTNAFPKPSLGSVFVRKNLNGNEEEAMIVSVQYSTKPGGLWQAVMLTKNGTEFVTGDQEHRNVHDWRPAGWIHDEMLGNWFSPDQKSKIDAERAKEAAEAPVAEVKDEYIIADAAAITAAAPKRKALAIPPLPQV